MLCFDPDIPQQKATPQHNYCWAPVTRLHPAAVLAGCLNQNWIASLNRRQALCRNGRHQLLHTSMPTSPIPVQISPGSCLNNGIKNQPMGLHAACAAACWAINSREHMPPVHCRLYIAACALPALFQLSYIQRATAAHRPACRSASTSYKGTVQPSTPST